MYCSPGGLFMDNNEEKLVDEAEYGEQVRIRREKLKTLARREPILSGRPISSARRVRRI